MDCAAARLLSHILHAGYPIFLLNCPPRCWRHVPFQPHAYGVVEHVKLRSDGPIWEAASFASRAAVALAHHQSMSLQLRGLSELGSAECSRDPPERNNDKRSACIAAASASPPAAPPWSTSSSIQREGNFIASSSEGSSRQNIAWHGTTSHKML